MAAFDDPAVTVYRAYSDVAPFTGPVCPDEWLNVLLRLAPLDLVKSDVELMASSKAPRPMYTPMPPVPGSGAVRKSIVPRPAARFDTVRASASMSSVRSRPVSVSNSSSPAPPFCPRTRKRSACTVTSPVAMLMPVW